jgi:hypothetical protein
MSRNTMVVYLRADLSRWTRADRESVAVRTPTRHRATRGPWRALLAAILWKNAGGYRYSRRGRRSGGGGGYDPR